MTVASLMLMLPLVHSLWRGNIVGNILFLQLLYIAVHEVGVTAANLMLKLPLV